MDSKPFEALVEKPQYGGATTWTVYNNDKQRGAIKEKFLTAQVGVESPARHEKRWIQTEKEKRGEE